MRRRSAARGFTLVELLVAISILAIIAVFSWRGLDGIIRSRAALTDEMATTRGLQLAFAQMQSDISNLANAVYLNRRPYIQAEDNRLTLVRMTLTENEPTRLQVVSYRVGEDGVLSRRESVGTRDLAELDALWQAALGDTDTATRLGLQSGVRGMRLRYWLGTGWTGAAGVTTGTSGGGSAAGTGTGSTGTGGTSGTTGTTNAGATAAASTPTGLEVTLVVQGQQLPLVKSYLLGEL